MANDEPRHSDTVDIVMQNSVSSWIRMTSTFALFLEEQSRLDDHLPQEPSILDIVVPFLPYPILRPYVADDRALEMCDICYEPQAHSGNTTTLMACGHKIDTICIQQWIRSDWAWNNYCCPMCRERFFAVREVEIDRFGNEKIGTVKFHPETAVNLRLYRPWMKHLDKEAMEEFRLDVDYAADRGRREIANWAKRLAGTN